MSTRPPLRSAIPLAVLLAATAGGCGWNDAVDSRAATAGLPDVRQLVEAHEWILDRADSSLTVDDDNPVTLSVTGDDVSGTAPCNVYRGDITLDDDSVEISDLALTTQACDGSIMDAEAEYIAALEAVDTVDADEDDNERLVLHDGDVRLVFRPYDADEALVTTWTVANVLTGDATTTVLDGTEPTLTFTDDGDVALDTGCNTASSTWQLDGHTLTVDPLRITRKSCDDPAGIMDQEAALVTALETADRVEITPGKLTLLDDDTITLIATTD
jgi:heat shock protein HslJ